MKKQWWISLLIILSIVLIGTDVWHFDFLGVNIRYIQFFYLAVVVFLFFIKKYYIKLNKPLIFLIIGLIFSVIFSCDILASLKYYLWIIYNVFFITLLFYSYTIIVGKEHMLKLFKYSIVAVFSLVCIQYVLDGVFNIELPIFSVQRHKGVIRVALWFYEPSYLATYLTIFMAIFSYSFLILKDKWSIIFLAITILTSLVTTSTTAYISIVACLGLASFLLLISRDHTIKYKLTMLGIELGLAIIFVGVVAIVFSDSFDLFVMRIFRNGLVSASGDRISSYSETIQVIKDNWLFGCGLGAYPIYMGKANYVPTNVTLELLATTGVVGTLSFYGLIVYYIYEVWFSPRKNKYEYSKMFVFALICFWIILQANQNFHRLYLWMIFGISSGVICLERKFIYIENNT